ncbi:uncharacterized protein CCOS01_07605 [Colletotrichum costaricense]|uniref:Uncharacterized protein n=1 Tax=Colletotrichum costaricense TaxID=1209916 RepID=A0AAJ0E1K2_9PEZI|nr:uncharacterized protein CCOS01_07605 [Colletotrichum costaricense]KAK1527343.1 hypothetical protein CCOS01_07605 [Colletotrichum costaricense]
MGRCSTHGSIGTRRGQTHCTMQPRGFSHLCLQRNASRSRSCGHDRHVCHSRPHHAAQAYRNLPVVTPSYLDRIRLQHARSPKATSRDLASFSHHSSQAANPPPKYHLLAVTGPPGWSPPSYLCAGSCACRPLCALPIDAIPRPYAGDAERAMPPVATRSMLQDAKLRWWLASTYCGGCKISMWDMVVMVTISAVRATCNSSDFAQANRLAYTASQTTDGRVHTLAAAAAIARSLMIDLRAAEARPRTSRTWMIPSPTSLCPPHGCHPSKPTRLGALSWHG